MISKASAWFVVPVHTWICHRQLTISINSWQAEELGREATCLAIVRVFSVATGVSNLGGDTILAKVLSVDMLDTPAR